MEDDKFYPYEVWKPLGSSKEAEVTFRGGVKTTWDYFGESDEN